jgi:Leucine-rich repeat (LRR) protein
LEALVFSSNSVRQIRLENKLKLEYVKLPACGGMASIRAVQCPKLSELHIPDCNLLTELHLEQCPRPLMLSLSCASSLAAVRMTDVSLYDVSATACYQFEHVAIESKSSINMLEFPYCHQLKSVTVMAPLYNLILDGCQQLTELDIANNHLERLHLSECHQLSDEQIFRAIKGSDGNLKQIDLRYNNKVSAATVKSIPTYAPHVKELMLSYCYHVTEDALLHVLANCNSLHQLFISGLQNVTDRVVEAAKNHPNLNILNVSSCPNVLQSHKKSSRNYKLAITL